MSCSNPIRIINPTHVLYKNLLQPYRYDVACGNCPDCIKAKRLEWRYRLHYQFMDCLHSDVPGFVLFDTLTYSDDYLPMFKSSLINFGLDDNINLYGFEDFSVFNYRDLTLFLKRFRKDFHFMFKNADFKYFYCSEYGQDERYTHRPHYHILFFFYGVNSSSARSLCDLVDKHWFLGRTDSFRNKDKYPDYWSWYNHNVLTSNNCDNVRVQAVSSYLCKYVTKSLDFDKVSKSHLSVVYNSLPHLSESKKLFLSFKCMISPCFHSSKNFGVSQIRNLLLTSSSYDIARLRFLSLPDKDNVLIKVPLTIYFRRKLFYYVHSCDDGTRQWRLTEVGLKNYWLRLCDRFNNVLSSLVTNLRSDDSLSAKVFSLLRGRSLEDFVFYKVCYQGRICDFSRSAEFNRLFPVEFVNQMDYLRSSFPVPREYFINYISHDDSSCSYVASSSSLESPLSIGDFCRLYLYNSNFIPEWSDFDLIDNIFIENSCYKHVVSTQVFELEEFLYKSLKSK